MVPTKREVVEVSHMTVHKRNERRPRQLRSPPRLGKAAPARV